MSVLTGHARHAARMVLIAIVALTSLVAASWAQDKPLKGVALVIGQSAYTPLPALANPQNDARMIDRLLGDLGFEVTTVLDADAARLTRTLARFAEDAQGADVALFYYSGHGIEAGGENYLIPVDAPRGDPKGLAAVSPLLEKLRAAVPVTILLLDACRTNPFPPGATLAIDGAAPVPVSVAGLGALKGVVPFKKAASSDSLGTVIGFAAEPGKAALDGDPGGASPYAAALAKHLPASGFAFGDVMTMVTEEVYLATSARQTPWTNASLRRQLYFGLAPEETASDDALIRGERRKLLLTIATTPRETRGLVEQVAQANGVPMDALYGMLAVLGLDPTKPDANLQQLLAQGATRLRDLKQARDVQERQDPEIIRLAGLADRAEKEGAIALALQFRDRASTRAGVIDKTLDDAEANIRQRRTELVETFAANAHTALLNFDFDTAAKRFADAFEQAERYDIARAYSLKVEQADALADHANFKGDNAAFERSIETYGEALKIGQNSPNPRRDAALRGNMAIAMTQLGRRSADMTWLERAVATYKDVAKSLPRKQYKDDWAYAQLNLGSLYNTLGDRSSDPRYYELAIKALKGAETVMTRKKMPSAWAGIQLNIGNAYHAMGLRDFKVETFEKARKSAEASLSVWTRQNDPVDWASAMNNLGSSMSEIARRRDDAAMMEQVVAIYGQVLEVTGRDRQPVDWASTKNNLGSSYLELAYLKGKPELVTDAISAWAEARQVLTRERDPHSYALTWHNEARALLFQGMTQKDPKPLVAAQAALSTAKDVLVATGNRLQWARTRSVEGEVLLALGVLQPDRATLIGASEAFAEASRTFREVGMGETGQGFWENQQVLVTEELKKLGD